jgi:hypothetical protein
VTALAYGGAVRTAGRWICASTRACCRATSAEKGEICYATQNRQDAVKAPEVLVREVIDWLRALGSASARDLDGVVEKLVFPVPRGSRRAGRWFPGQRASPEPVCDRDGVADPDR